MDNVVPIIEAHEARLHADLEIFRVVHTLHGLVAGDGALARALADFDLTPDKLDVGEDDGTLRLDEVKSYIRELHRKGRAARALVKSIVDDVLPLLQRVARLAGGDTEDVTMLATDEFLMGEEGVEQAIEAFGRGSDELRTCALIINAVQAAAADLPTLHYDTQLALSAASKPPRKAALCVPVVKEFLTDWARVCAGHHALALRVGAQLGETRGALERLCGCVHVNFE